MMTRFTLTFCLAAMVAATPTEQCGDADDCGEGLKAGSFLQSLTSSTKLTSMEVDLAEAPYQTVQSVRFAGWIYETKRNDTIRLDRASEVDAITACDADPTCGGYILHEQGYFSLFQRDSEDDWYVHGSAAGRYLSVTERYRDSFVQAIKVKQGSSYVIAGRGVFCGYVQEYSSTTDSPAQCLAWCSSNAGCLAFVTYENSGCGDKCKAFTANDCSPSYQVPTPCGGTVIAYNKQATTTTTSSAHPCDDGTNVCSFEGGTCIKCPKCIHGYTCRCQIDPPFKCTNGCTAPFKDHTCVYDDSSEPCVKESADAIIGIDLIEESAGNNYRLMAIEEALFKEVRPGLVGQRVSAAVEASMPLIEETKPYFSYYYYSNSDKELMLIIETALNLTPVHFSFEANMTSTMKLNENGMMDCPEFKRLGLCELETCVEFFGFKNCPETCGFCHWSDVTDFLGAPRSNNPHWMRW